MNLKGTDANWMEQFNGGITVCNREGIIVYMNRHSIEQFKKSGGEGLIGSNLLDCHPEPAKSKLKEMLLEPVENMYTIEKDGKRKLILQTPWTENNEFKGIVELSVELQPGMQHFIRS